MHPLMPCQHRDEVRKATSHLSYYVKAPGRDCIPAEMYKCEGNVLIGRLTELSVCEKQVLPQNFKDASIVHLYKRKGNRQDCEIIDASV